MSTSQPVRVKTPFADDLLFSRMDGFEELGRLYQYELELVSLKQDLALDDLLGKDLTVEMDLPSGDTRYVHGYVTEFSLTGGRGRYATYSAIIHPWFWFLTQTSDCRIFQGKKVPEIIKEVCRDLGFTDFKDSLTAEYRNWEYCVQYRETDFNFISRLMEQEGIYYFFEHEDGKHTLVMCDAYGAHSPLPNYEKIPYYPPTESVRREHIHDWNLSKSVRTGSCAIGAFHFLKPKANLEVTSSIMHPHAHDDLEIYDYPGEYYERGEGDRYVGVRMEELACDYERVKGETNARGVFPGGLFELEEFPRDDQNREYLVVSTQHSVTGVNYESGDASSLKYDCSFEAINSQDPFRAARTTPKPIVQGPQTALVVGKSGEEIWTDEYGRVKVQFHWDRYGKNDENSSCWIRVSQSWAGGQWGGMSIPRMGQEVVVDFIEGDPDRPIVTGRVYNKDNMPPYDLPADKTKSTLKSRSTKGASADNFNEIRFEDLKGSEEMYVHAEKDQNTVVENDQGILVEHNRNKTVDVDQEEHVGNNKKISVVANHTETVGANFDLAVGGSKSESVSVNSAESISIAKTLSIGAAYQITVGAAMNTTVGGAKMVEVGGLLSETVGVTKSASVAGNSSEDVGGSKSVNIGKDRSDLIGGKQTGTVKKGYELKAKKIELTAEDEIIFKAGKAQIIMKKNGDIQVSGNNIELKGKGKINVKASKDVIIKGSKIKEN